ncbi:cobyrinate a,c-diamide synthase, partial [Ralstonia pseudosolanacearum]
SWSPGSSWKIAWCVPWEKTDAGLAGLGLQTVDLGDGELRGHTFHYSSLATPLAPATHARRAHGAGNAAPGEAVYRHGSIVASYLHAYFPSNPTAAARLFRP